MVPVALNTLPLVLMRAARAAFTWLCRVVLQSASATAHNHSRSMVRGAFKSKAVFLLACANFTRFNSCMHIRPGFHFVSAATGVACMLVRARTCGQLPML